MWLIFRKVEAMGLSGPVLRSFKGYLKWKWVFKKLLQISGASKVVLKIAQA